MTAAATATKAKKMESNNNYSSVGLEIFASPYIVITFALLRIVAG